MTSFWSTFFIVYLVCGGLTLILIPASLNEAICEVKVLLFYTPMLTGEMKERGDTFCDLARVIFILDEPALDYLAPTGFEILGIALCLSGVIFTFFNGSRIGPGLTCKIDPLFEEALLGTLGDYCYLSGCVTRLRLTADPKPTLSTPNLVLVILNLVISA